MAIVTLKLSDQFDGAVVISLESQPRIQLEALTPAQRLAMCILSTPEPVEAK